MTIPETAKERRGFFMNKQFGKFHSILNIICGLLVLFIGVLLLATGIFISIREQVIPPVMILTPISVFLFYLAYYHFIVNKTKLKNLTDKQERFIHKACVISIVVFSVVLLSMLMVIIGCLMYGPLVETGFLFYFIGVAIFSALLVIESVLINKTEK